MKLCIHALHALPQSSPLISIHQRAQFPQVGRIRNRALSVNLKSLVWFS
jgi:hypothetical protein